MRIKKGDRVIYNGSDPELTGQPFTVTKASDSSQAGSVYDLAGGDDWEPVELYNVSEDAVKASE